jgi:hypothetical protein
MSEDVVPLEDDEDRPQIPPDPGITPQLFREWRSPRHGSANPERMNNRAWEWLVRSRVNAFQATQQFDGPSALEAGPGWCFQRFGQSKTRLPDGRLVFIAGEHEDHYDPDFYIYNDVVVQQPDGRLDIWGYPPDVFPPTDFHSATLVGDRIVIIGNLGYLEQRRPGKTPVFVLDLSKFSISQVVTSGTPPGWIHSHAAKLSKDGTSIIITGGKLDRGDPDTSLVENIDDWGLHIHDWRWERLLERRWRRWELRRSDGGPNHLFDIQQALWATQVPSLGGSLDQMKAELGVPPLAEQLGMAPDLDLFERRYRPDVPHEVLPQRDTEFGVYRIRVNAVIVRYVEDSDCIHLTVEGELLESTINALTADLLDKFSRLENAPCELKPI